MVAVAIGSLLLTWFLISFAFISLGTGIASFALRSPTSGNSGQTLLGNFWLGFAGALAFCQLWHFAFPINGYAELFFVLICATCAWFMRSSLRVLWSQLPITPLRLLLFGLFILWVSERCLSRPYAFDTGFYDIPVVQWTEMYAIVPGLGNLHDRLGFNNSSLLYAALFDHGYWYQRTSHLSHGLLLCAFYAQVLGAAFRLFGKAANRSYDDAFSFALLPVAIYLTIDDFFFDVASLTTDYPTAILMFYLAALFLRIVVSGRIGAQERGSSEPQSHTGADAAHLVFQLIVLSAAAITVKLSSVVFCAVAIAVVLVYALYGSRPSLAVLAGVSLYRRTLATALVCSAALIVPWLARGVVLTGYPLYPLTVFAAPVDWKMPVVVAHFQKEFILAFARVYYDGNISYQYRRGMPWLHAWFSHLYGFSKIEIILPALLAILAITVVLMTLKRRGHRWAVLLLLLPDLACLLNWFVQAPSPRFALFAMWILAATLLTFAFWGTQFQSLRRYGAVVALAALVVMLGRAGGRLMRHTSVEGVVKVFYSPPGSDGGFQPLQYTRTCPVITDSGILLHVALLNYYGPQPSTPWPEKTLVLRVPGHMEHGFRVRAQTTGISGTGYVPEDNPYALCTTGGPLNW